MVENSIGQGRTAVAAATEFMAKGIKLRLSEPTPEELSDAWYELVEAHVAALERGQKSNDEALYHILLDDWPRARSCGLGEPEREGVAARFRYLVAACLVYAETGQPVFRSAADYKARQNEPLAVAALPHLQRAFPS